MMKHDWSTACPDWAARLRSGQSIIPPPLFPDQADQALGIFRQLRIVDAPGSPTFGEACAPWVFDFVRAIFGAYDAESGRRLIKEALLLIPKKNSKSTIAAGIMITALILNWRASAELIILAPTIEIANNAYAPARDMVKADEELSELLHVQDHIRTITHRTMGSTLKVVAADNDTVGGKKASWVLIDEEWIFGKRPNAENMFREATGGLVSRPEGMVIKLSTQSDEPPAGIFRQDLQYARDVRDGIREDKHFLPVLYEFPPDMVQSRAYLNPDNFGIVNPNLNFSVDRPYLERELTKAQSSGEESLRGFLAKHLNVEIGLALRSDRWAGADYWQQQGRPGITLDSLLERSEVVTVGIDGGGLDDLLGLCIMGRDAETGKWLAWHHAWAHPSVLERRKAEAARFRDFERDGDLTIVHAIGDDIAELADMVARVEAYDLLDRVGLDPAGIGGLLDALIAAEIPQDKIIGISQGWKLGGSIKTAERKLAEGIIEHDNTPLMAWCVGNAKVEPRGNAILITKQASGSAKIDPLMAHFNAVQLMSLNPDARSGPGIYTL